ncbi:MAG TPA: protoporphyrinogen oxidase [Gemmatimonas sp.]|nr:protoporphyrinogen oxidase [Gemmatimonas sp.]
MRVLTDQVGSVPTDQNDPGDHRSVAVVGAGITGLVAAYELRRRGVNVTLYEASSHTGGVIRTSHVEGYLSEHGPNSFVTSPPVEQLLTQLDLQNDVVEANPGANKRFVVRSGKLVPFPLSPPAMLSTGLFSMRAKLRVLLEPLVKAGGTDGDESVASFVRRRLGREVLDYAVDPFISGIFAGDPEALSMAHAFPRVFELERAHGSLSKGLMAQRSAASKARKGANADVTAAVTAAVTAVPRPRLISFLDGMGTLTDALEAALVGTLRLNCPVRLLHRADTRWVLDAGPEGESRTRAIDAVVMATPAHVMAAMELPAALRRFAAPVEQVEYPPVSTLTLGFHRRDVAHPLDGFGMLIPSVEKRSVLGALFSSSLFPSRAPDDHVAITCFVGGARYPSRARENTEMLVERVMHDLRDLVGVRGEPTFVKHVYWPKAIPQYNVGYAAVKEAADAMETANPGLYLAGNYRNGVSVGDCVASGQLIAERVQAYLARAG